MIRTQHCCPSCETEWLGPEPCFLCGCRGEAGSLVRYRWVVLHWQDLSEDAGQSTDAGYSY